jgi:hypothetical protein
MGKYRLILKASFEDEELQTYMRFFKSRGEVLDVMRNQSALVKDAVLMEESDEKLDQERTKNLLKCFNHYKTFAKQNLEDSKANSEEQLLSNFL